MSSIGNKIVFSRNLRELMEQRGKDRKQVCTDLGFKYTTFTDWYNGNKYPRIDKIEILADYFGVLKSDLIEDKTDMPPEVVSIVGSQGTLLSETDLGIGSEYATTMWKWEGEGSTGATAHIMFQDGKVVNKSQIGLE